MLDKFLNDNSMTMRLVRTIAQGIIAVLIVAVPLAISGVIKDPQWAAVATAAIMAVLSPIMAMLKSGKPEDGLEGTEEE